MPGLNRHSSKTSSLALRAVAVFTGLFLLAGSSSARAQELAPPREPKPPAVSTALGDMPTDPGARTKLPSDLQPAHVRAIVRLVADRELRRTADAPSQDWTMAPLYLGLLAASRTLGDPRYHNEVLRHAEGFHWTLGPREAHADDEAIGQVYIELYRERSLPERIGPMHAAFLRVMHLPDSPDPNHPLWWWCDALFMAPPAWVGLSSATGDPALKAFAARQWHRTDNLLWSPENQLFSRDASYLEKHESNGEKLFWSRGNGWVMGGLVRVLDQLPPDDAERPFYEGKLRAMAASVAAIQGSDGLWRPGLLEPGHYPLPETSGSAFFLYAIAWGVNHRILPPAQYLPVLRKGWAGLVGQTYADGRLGAVQPIGAAPGAFEASASYVYGSGALLLAGSEIERLQPPAGHKSIRRKR